MNKISKRTLDILEFLQSGGGIEQAAERFNTTVGNVNAIRHRHGLTKKHIEITETVIETIRQYRVEGKTIKEIAACFGASRQWVDTVVSKYRLTRDFSPRVCERCGAEFNPKTADQMFCSIDCQRKVQHRKENAKRRINRRAKIHDALVDPDITLERVFEKDNGICYLCGDACEWIDFTDADGVFIAGDSYPSIDHVIPLAKGGKHEWGNVRLAHMYCNTLKSDGAYSPHKNLLPATL